jgi:hypothetical protein
VCSPFKIFFVCSCRNNRRIVSLTQFFCNINTLSLSLLNVELSYGIQKDDVKDLMKARTGQIFFYLQKYSFYDKKTLVAAITENCQIVFRLFYLFKNR